MWGPGPTCGFLPIDFCFCAQTLQHLAARSCEVVGSMPICQSNATGGLQCNVRAVQLAVWTSVGGAEAVATCLQTSVHPSLVSAAREPCQCTLTAVASCFLQIQKRSNDGKLNIKFMGRVDHLDPQLRPYKVTVVAFRTWTPLQAAGQP